MSTAPDMPAASGDADFGPQELRIEPARVMFLYWGRRGMSRLALEVARAALANNTIRATFSVSRQNDRLADFVALGGTLVPVDTFSVNVGALLHAHRISAIRRLLLRHIADHRPQAVIELMPHVWSPFVMPTLKAAGVRYVAFVHDATPHPGDYRSAAASWLLTRTIRQADVLLTLSKHVATEVKDAGLVPHDRIFALFHPDLRSHNRCTLAPPHPGEPWRLLFLGRIMPYKGLPLFLDMVEELRKRGIAVNAGVFGEGNLNAYARRLAALRAEVTNRWLTDEEIETVLPHYHAVVLSHIEASQSGVVAVAFGAGVPVVATPVGGLVEQVEDAVTGVLAARVDAEALSGAVMRLLTDSSLYLRIRTNLAATKEVRSVRRFVQRCVHYALQAEVRPGMSRTLHRRD